MGVIEIHRILDEVRLLGCSDLHFTDRIAPVVRLNGTLRTMRSQYPEMDEEEILDIVHQMTNDAQQTSIDNHHDTDTLSRQEADTVTVLTYTSRRVSRLSLSDF